MSGKLEQQDDDDRFFRQFLFLRRAVSCAICSCVIFPSCECVSRCFLVLRRAQLWSGRWSHDFEHVQAIRVLLDVKPPTLNFCMNDAEIPLLDCEDAPGWLCLVQSRDDEATTEFCCAAHVHDLARSF